MRLFSLLLATTVSMAADMVDIVAPNRALIGVWVAHYTSTDGGRTVEPAGREVFGRMTHTTLQFGSETYRIDQIVETRTQEGNLANMMSFTNSESVVAVSDSSPGFFMVQIFNGREKLRMIISVEK
jgi:hypothetical protein